MTETNCIKFNIVLPSETTRLGHLKHTGEQVFETTMDIDDRLSTDIAYRISLFTRKIGDKLNLPEGIDIKPMVEKAINDAMILGYLNDAMSITINNPDNPVIKDEDVLAEALSDKD